MAGLDQLGAPNSARHYGAVDAAKRLDALANQRTHVMQVPAARPCDKPRASGGIVRERANLRCGSTDGGDAKSTPSLGLSALLCLNVEKLSEAHSSLPKRAEA